MSKIVKHLIMPKFKNKFSPIKIYKDNPDALRILIRYITQCNGLKSYLFKIGRVDSPNCDSCNTPETLDHFLWECDKYTEFRQILEQNFSETKVVAYVLATGKDF